MIADVDESSARAIIEHAKNLSGGEGAYAEGRTADDVRPTAIKASDSVVAASIPLVPSAQFPSESGHWYEPKTGNQVELPPRTQTRTALKRGYVPGVTTITKVAHKEAIQRWMVNRAIKFSRKVCEDHAEVGLMGCDGFISIDEECLTSEVWQLLNADSDAITGRGKELHTAIELCAQGKDWPGKWDEHIFNVQAELRSHGLLLATGNIEHTFATSRYGGKIDFHNDEWLLDYKTKPRIEDGKKLAYPEHAQQLAAYDAGIGRGALANDRRCANVFIGVEDAKVVFHEWDEKDLLQGWEEFECLLNTWWKIATRNMKK